MASPEILNLIFSYHVVFLFFSFLTCPQWQEIFGIVVIINDMHVCLFFILFYFPWILRLHIFPFRFNYLIYFRIIYLMFCICSAVLVKCVNAVHTCLKTMVFTGNKEVLRCYFNHNVLVSILEFSEVTQTYYWASFNCILNVNIAHVYKTVSLNCLENRYKPDMLEVDYYFKPKRGNDLVFICTQNAVSVYFLNNFWVVSMSINNFVSLFPQNLL